MGQQVYHSLSIYEFEGMRPANKVRRRLEELQVTTFMVEAGGGGEFGSLTLMGLGRAKAMVAFCTEEYGALTGATRSQALRSF